MSSVQSHARYTMVSPPNSLLMKPTALHPTDQAQPATLLSVSFMETPPVLVIVTIDCEFDRI